MSESFKINLDPRSVLEGLKAMGGGARTLSETIQKYLGILAPLAIDNLGKESEKGANKIQKHFSNLGTRIKEDLKSAFDLGMLFTSFDFYKSLKQGTHEAINMERAFDRLNVRLGYSAKELDHFKSLAGKKIAEQGQSVESVLPGLEVFQGRGRLNDPYQLAAIGETLAKVQNIGGNEDIKGLSNTIVNMIHEQGRNVTSTSVRQMLDIVEATRKSAGLDTAGDAAARIKELSPFGANMRMSMRDIGGMIGVSSRAGDRGMSILSQIMSKSASEVERIKLNAVLGTNIFGKNGTMNPEAFANINMKRFGSMSPEILEQATGLQGASGQDLKQFVEAWQKSMKEYRDITQGHNEVSEQNAVATDNLAHMIDQYSEKMKESGSEVMGSMSKIGLDAMKGDFAKIPDDMKGVAGKVWSNKGNLIKGFLATAAYSAVVGDSANSLMGKLGGGGAASAAESAKRSGFMPVFVTNLAENFDKYMGKKGNILWRGAKWLGKAALFTGGTVALGAVGLGAAKLAGAGAVGAAGGTAAGMAGDKYLPKQVKNAITQPSDWLYDMMHTNDQRFNFDEKADKFNPEEFKKAMVEGTIEGLVKASEKINADKTTTYTQPSDVTGRGTSMGRNY